MRSSWPGPAPASATRTGRAGDRQPSQGRTQGRRCRLYRPPRSWPATRVAQPGCRFATRTPRCKSRSHAQGRLPGFRNGDLPTGQARAVVFAALLAGQTLLILIERTPRAAIRRARSRRRRAGRSTRADDRDQRCPSTCRRSPTLLHFWRFPAAGWLGVAGIAAISTLWAEPLKIQHSSRPPTRTGRGSRGRASGSHATRTGAPACEPH